MNISMHDENMNILDLPNEMLYAIFNKLNITDVLYSLTDVNQLFNQLIFDSLFIRDLNLTMESSLGIISPADDKVLDKICKRILPRINHKVTKLTVEPLSMERILDTVDYPQLHSLSLVEFRQEILLQHLADDTILHSLIAHQITDLKVRLEDEITPEISDRPEFNVFAMLLSKCKCLTKLTYRQWFEDRLSRSSILNLPATSCVSSTLTKLNIGIDTLDDCLYLLDGRLESLSTLIVIVGKVLAASSNLDNTRDLPKLKCFSLTSYSQIYFYDSRIVPLLRRMSNLLELTLFLTVIRYESTYIDGTHLYDETLNYMPRLTQFKFSILTTVHNMKTGIDLPTNDDVQRSFSQRGREQIGSYVVTEPSNMIGECRIYSIPYQFNDFVYLNNRFPGGKFDKVRFLAMCDIDPFEHQLFEIVSRDFPFLRTLGIINSKGQQNKQDSSSSSITFSHLINLYVSRAHADYAEQFLVKRTSDLPRLKSLQIKYETLEIVTNNFTNDATRFNCAQLQELVIKEPFIRPENFQSYFPLL